MNLINKFVTFEAGTPQSRIFVSELDSDPEYLYYSQVDLDNDLIGLDIIQQDNKKVRTPDDVVKVYKGNVVFSLISGKATIVRECHNDYLITQNFVKISTSISIDSKYLVYLLNEDQLIKQQFISGMQGSMILKYSLRQLRELELPILPPIEIQKVIGDTYLKALKLNALKIKVSEMEKEVLLKQLKGGFGK